MKLTVKILISAFTIGVSFAFFQAASASTAEMSALVPTAQKSAETKSDIGYADAFILGIVEGVTEYLPVSSTGHLILANAALELDGDTPLLNSAGEKIPADDGAFTMKDAADAYAIVIQFGAILAVAILYWEYILKMFFGVLGRNPQGFRLAVNLAAAFLPAAILGLLLHSLIEKYLFGITSVIIALATGALLMFYVQKRYDARAATAKSFGDMENLTLKQALVIGFLQCVAMWPGTSRSMMTILGGYAVGLRPADAAKFSFLLGLVTLTAASLFKLMKVGGAMAETLSVGPLAAGMFVAFISAAISVKWMVGFLTRRGLVPFAWYRIFIAIVIGGALCFNFI